MYYENMGDSNTRGEKKINHTQKGKIDFTFFVFMLLTFNNSKNIKGFFVFRTTTYKQQCNPAQ